MHPLYYRIWHTLPEEHFRQEHPTRAQFLLYDRVSPSHAATLLLVGDMLKAQLQILHDLKILKWHQ